MYNLVVPAAIATAAGIGMDLMANMLSPYWPDAPHWMFGVLFWTGVVLTVLPFPMWVIWKCLHYGQYLLGCLIAAISSIIFIMLIFFLGLPHESKGNPIIFAECNYGLWPSAYPPNGRIYFTNIQSSSAPSSLGYFFGDPGSQSSRIGPFKFDHECKLTNYSILPVFDVKISLYAIFKEAIVETATARKSGNVKVTREWPLEIPKIDPGKENPFVFYIVNFSKDFVDISLPRTITLRREADQVEQTFPLNQPTHIYLLLMPFNEDK